MGKVRSIPTRVAAVRPPPASPRSLANLCCSRRSFSSLLCVLSYSCPLNDEVCSETGLEVCSCLTRHADVSQVCWRSPLYCLKLHRAALEGVTTFADILDYECVFKRTTQTLRGSRVVFALNCPASLVRRKSEDGTTPHLDDTVLLPSKLLPDLGGDLR